MEKKISKYLKQKLGKEYKYDKKSYEELYQSSMEEYDTYLSNSMTEAEAFEKVKNHIDLSVLKLTPKSKFLFIMVVSIISLLVASIECVLLSGDFPYILPEFILMACIFLGVVIYACFIKTNKTKWNFLLILLVVTWLISFGLIGMSGLQMWGGNPIDTITEVNFIFPCIYKLTRYSSLTSVLAEEEIRSVIGVYLNWIVSFVLSVVFVVLYLKSKWNKKIAD